MEVALHVGSLDVLLGVAGYAVAERADGALDGCAIVEEAGIEAVYLLLQLGGMAVASCHRGERRFVARLVAPQHQQVRNAEELQIDKDILRLLAAEAAAEDVRHHAQPVVCLDGSSHSYCARTLTHRHTLVEAGSRLAIHALAAMCGNVDVLRVKLTQHVNVGKQPLNAHTLQRGQHLKRKSSQLSPIYYSAAKLRTFFRFLSPITKLFHIICYSLLLYSTLFIVVRWCVSALL